MLRDYHAALCHIHTTILSFIPSKAATNHRSVTDTSAQIQTRALVSSYQCGHISLSAAPVRAHEEGRNQDRVDTAQFKSEATLQL